jgi:hypothetical protein
MGLFRLNHRRSADIKASDTRADMIPRIDLIVILEARGILKAPCIVVQDRLTFKG